MTNWRILIKPRAQNDELACPYKPRAQIGVSLLIKPQELAVKLEHRSVSSSLMTSSMSLCASEVTHHLITVLFLRLAEGDERGGGGITGRQGTVTV